MWCARSVVQKTWVAGQIQAWSMSGVVVHQNQWSGLGNAVAEPQLESLHTMEAGQRGLQEQWAWSWGALWWAPKGGHHDKAPNALTVARVQPIRTMN